MFWVSHIDLQNQNQNLTCFVLGATLTYVIKQGELKIYATETIL